MDKKKEETKSLRSYSEFKRALRLRESSDDYACENRLGYLGAYQFGMARLCDLGLTRRIAPGMGNKSFAFVPPYSKAGFLTDAKLQDQCFDLHVFRLKKYIMRYCPTDNLSGAIAAAHLLGPGGAEAFIARGEDGCDAFGTKCSEYFEKFRGYQIL